MIEALAGWPGAVLLQRSGTAYLFVNAAHILGIGLLVGAILPLDLRLAGLLPAGPIPTLAPVLSRAAALGLCLALATGFWLFTVKPAEYLANPAFLTKLALLAAAGATVALQHGGPGYRMAVRGGPIGWPVRAFAAVSAALWLAVLLAGRWIGFV